MVALLPQLVQQLLLTLKDAQLAPYTGMRSDFVYISTKQCA